jgi:hypothetical protein
MTCPVPERRTVEYRDLNADLFGEIRAAARPVILKGLVADWPAVRAGAESPMALGAHLAGFATGQPVRFIVAPPERGGMFFYVDDLKGTNFEAREAPLTELLHGLLHWMDRADPPSMAAQSLPEPVAVPGFAAANPAPAIVGPAVPRLWIGNAAVVQTHHDMFENLACAVAGRRRFTLFPPSATRNLYVGPFERTLAGPLVSMVPLHAADAERWPRFADAWAQAEVADLEPGDALYIPYMWWHHVQSFDPFALLVNYWWNPEGQRRQPMQALIHAMAEIRDMPSDQRDAWRAMFDAFVFDDDAEPGAHLPLSVRGIQGRMDTETSAAVLASLARGMARQS